MRKVFTKSFLKKVKILILSLDTSSQKQSRKNAINLPRTEEELKEFEKAYKDVSNALKFYDEFLPRNQYFKPHTANAKRFLHNLEFIYKQLNLNNASKEWVSSFLGIE